MKRALSRIVPLRCRFYGILKVALVRWASSGFVSAASSRIFWRRGKKALGAFYSQRFIPQMPPDTSMIAVSRTIGKDRLVDEMIFKFTHTVRMDWMLPGIEPTGKRVEVPLVAIVHFRDDKLAHEHIYWDQASVLVQLGLLDAKNLPVVGIQSAHKVLDNSIPSNELIERADRMQA